MERLKKNLVLALCLGVAVYLVLALLAGFGDLRSALASFEYSLVPTILGLVLLSYVVRFVRWAYYLRLLDVRMSLAKNVTIFAAGLSMTISPGKLGGVLKSVFIRQVNGTPIAHTVPAVVTERVTDGTGMVLWGLLGALAFGYGLGSLLWFLTITGVGIAVLRSKRLSLLAEKTLSRLPLLNRLTPHVGAFHGGSNELLAARPLVVGTFLSLCSWGLELLAVYLCVVAIGAEVHFLVVTFIFAVASLGGALTMLPGGIGAAEASMVGMFASIANLSGGLSVALTFVLRLATVWFATLIGLLGLLFVSRWWDARHALCKKGTGQ